MGAECSDSGRLRTKSELWKLKSNYKNTEKGGQQKQAEKNPRSKVSTRVDRTGGRGEAKGTKQGGVRRQHRLEYTGGD